MLCVLIFSTNPGLVFLFFFSPGPRERPGGKANSVKSWIHYCVCLFIVDFMLFLGLVDGKKEYLEFY